MIESEKRSFRPEAAILLPMLARPKRIEDVGMTDSDHRANAIRYGCLRKELAAQVKLVKQRS